MDLLLMKYFLCQRLKVALIGCLLLAFSSTGLEAAERKAPDAIAIVVDIPLRVFGIGATVIGSGVFLVVLPFALTSGSTGATWDALVVSPFRFTFVRPMGGVIDDWKEMESNEDED